jgi:hypothetical protein
MREQWPWSIVMDFGYFTTVVISLNERSQAPGLQGSATQPAATFVGYKCVRVYTHIYNKSFWRLGVPIIVIFTCAAR